MDEKMIRRQLKKKMGVTGWSLLLYSLVMNVCVIAAVMVQTVVLSLQGSMPEGDALEQIILGNAWGYLIACVIALLLIIIWKKPHFLFSEIWQKEKDLKPKTFFALLVVFLAAQGAFQLFANILELVFNQFGFSVLQSIEAASIVPDTLSMFLYVGLFAPIVEEIIFRGLLLRLMRPYGKTFAILTSAFLFGMFHGNIVQSPYAFLVGLVLGYITVEYSIGWAMVLHMANNLILGDTFSRISQLLPEGTGDVLFALLIWGCLIAGIVILIVKRREIKAYRTENPIHLWCVKSFFGSGGVICFTIVMALTMLAGITLL